jgi:large subunit ribosomal protein L33
MAIKMPLKKYCSLRVNFIVHRMFLTLQNLSKKGRTLLVQVKSVASNHKFLMLREKAGEKLEFIRYDPMIDRQSVYKEVKKIRTVDKPGGGTE